MAAKGDESVKNNEGAGPPPSGGTSDPATYGSRIVREAGDIDREYELAQDSGDPVTAPRVTITPEALLEMLRYGHHPHLQWLAEHSGPLVLLR